MRPSARHVTAIGRLNVPIRPAPQHICVQCQRESRPAIYPPSRKRTASVRYASSNKPSEKEKIQWSERFRRKIWGTDNPPGQKDPYSKASPEEMARMLEEERRLQEEESREAKPRNKWLQRKTKEPPAVSQESEVIAAQATSVEAEDDIPYNPSASMMIPTKEEAEELGYVESTTWEGLPRVGVKYDAAREMQDYLRDNPFIPYIGSRKVDRAMAPRIVKQALSAAVGQPAVEPSDTASEDSHNSQIQPITDQWTASDGKVYRIEGDVRSGERSWTEFDISRDLNFKFKLIKQVMRLSRSRIPDPAIAGFTTVGDVVQFLEVPERPTALVDLLLQKPELRALPNVEIRRGKRTTTKIDDEFGLHKEIRKEYKARGLLRGQAAS